MNTARLPVARRSSPLAVCALGALLISAACTGEQGEAASPGGASKGGGGPGGGPGGGGRPPLVLAANDIAQVRRGAIEAGLPISGDLRPIQTVTVRARLEGDLVGVYVRPGERVNRGQLLAQFESSEEESDRQTAIADRTAAQSDVATAQWNHEQSRELFRAGAVPERDARVAEQALSAARARLAAAEARVRASGSILTDTRVLAPIAGVVEARQVEGDERVSRGAELFTIVRGDRLELAAALPERLSAGVRSGQAVRFFADGRSIEGTVARVSPTVDPSTRSVTVFVEVPNANGALKGNTFVTGRVVGRTIPDALLVPTTALRQAQTDPNVPSSESGSNDFVYRLAGDVVERAPVSLGVVDEASGMAEVVDGLREGDRVIVGNVAAVGRGVRVQVLGTEQRGGAPNGGTNGGTNGGQTPRAARP